MSDIFYGNQVGATIIIALWKSLAQFSLFIVQISILALENRGVSIFDFFQSSE